jgi:hypothetical protein
VWFLGLQIFIKHGKAAFGSRVLARAESGRRFDHNCDLVAGDVFNMRAMHEKRPASIGVSDS